MTDSRDKNQKIDKSRRGFTGLSISTPVLMTLASRPVLAVNCLSETMSGNLSEHQHNNCVPGLSPGAYKTEQGAGDWPVPYVRDARGNYDPTATFVNESGATEDCGYGKNGKPIKDDGCYVSAGSLLSDTPIGHMFMPRYQSLTLTHCFDSYNGESNDVAIAHYLAALFNTMEVDGYALGNGAEGLANLIKLIEDYHLDGTVPGGFTHLSSYLDTTWNKSR